MGSMTGLYSDQTRNYANFRILSETLHADVLDAEYAEGIMNFRESHRGTMTGMTRFRSVIDDMPILGYGSLCMVSAIPVSMWVRWMLVQEDSDEGTVYLA